MMEVRVLFFLDVIHVLIRYGLKRFDCMQYLSIFLITSCHQIYMAAFTSYLWLQLPIKLGNTVYVVANNLYSLSYRV
jgi:hypothetical protein